MRPAFLVTVLVLVIAQCAYAMHISEVMYNPEGNDNNREFVEIYLDNNQSLVNWSIGDSSSNDTLEPLFLTDSSYALVVEEGYDYENSDVSYYSAGATIGNNLNNDFDKVYLYDTSGSLVDSMSYDGTLANNDGMSMELFNGSWYESLAIGGTPGRKNSVYEYFSTLSGNESANVSNTTADEECNETIIQHNETNESISNESVQEENQTSQTNATEGNETSYQQVKGSCNISISITSGKLIYDDGEKIPYRISLNNDSYPYIIEYWAEDMQGNVVKSPYNTTNMNQRAWTPDCGKGSAFLIKARIAEVGCNDTSNLDNRAEMPIVVRCPASRKDEEQYHESISIEGINLGSDNSAKFGESIRVKLYITKGSTSKTAIDMYAEGADGKVSETTSMNIDSKNSETAVTIPLLIKPDCDDELDEGEYTLVVSGLGVEDTKEFRIEGHKSGLCKTVTRTVTNTEYRENDCSCLDVKPELVYKPKPKIKSFYTLAKKYSERLRLFANVECPGTCVLDLSNKTQVIEKRKLQNFSGKIDFNVSASRAYVLQISDVAQSMNMSPELDFPETVLSAAVVSGKETSPPYRAGDQITGDAVRVPEVLYESRNEQSKRWVKFFILGAAGILVAIVLFRKFS